MQMPDLGYDAGELKAEFIRRHHSEDLGTMLFEAEQKRRTEQNARVAVYLAEVADLDRQISVLCLDAKDRLVGIEARRDERYREYISVCEEAALMDIASQQAIQPLRQKMNDVQRQMFAITQRRSNERDMINFGASNSTNGQLLSLHTKPLPPMPTPAMDALALVNYEAGST